MLRYRHFVFALLLVPSAALCAEPDIREGLWELKVEFQVAGQAIGNAPMVIRQCISNQSIQDLMTQTGGGSECKVSDLQREANHAQWKFACTGAMDVSGTGETEIGDDQFAGKMALVINMGGESMPMEQTFSARRLGACQ